MEREMKILEAALLAIDVLSAYVLFKRVSARYSALRGREAR